MVRAPAEPNVRRVAIGRDRELCVRAATPGDVDGVQALYDGLDIDDRYRRFFSVYHPRRSFFEHMTDAADRGRIELVAVVSTSGADEIVGEAGCTMLPNGDAELAITVADRWRGWLGPYLLDALLAEAAARGIPNLEAVVLRVNDPMLAIARARGGTPIESSDLSEVRLRIRTTPANPS